MKANKLFLAIFLAVLFVSCGRENKDIPVSESIPETSFTVTEIPETSESIPDTAPEETPAEEIFIPEETAPAVQAIQNYLNCTTTEELEKYVYSSALAEEMNQNHLLDGLFFGFDPDEMESFEIKSCEQLSQNEIDSVLSFLGLSLSLTYELNEQQTINTDELHAENGYAMLVSAVYAFEDDFGENSKVRLTNMLDVFDIKGEGWKIIPLSDMSYYDIEMIE